MAPESIQKQQFQNNTNGFIGAVVIGPRGDERGIPVEPNGTVWLSEQEQRLTANAPRRAQDNPFIEQDLVRTDTLTGERVIEKITPLTPISEDRFVPADARPIPGTASAHQELAAAQAAATGDEPQTAVTETPNALTRHEELKHVDEPKPNVPARAAAAAAAAPAPTEDETAAKVNPEVGEETGAALPPSGEAAAGSFTQGEEVGTPEAPQAPSESAQGPTPWSPEQG